MEYVRCYCYDTGDRMTYCRYGNGLEERRSYDLQDRLVSQQLSTAAGLSMHQRAYGYDANSNVVRLSVDGLAKRYAYDSLDRLVEDGGVSPAARYEYDLNGNRQRRDLVDESTIVPGYTLIIVMAMPITRQGT